MPWISPLSAAQEAKWFIGFPTPSIRLYSKIPEFEGAHTSAGSQIAAIPNSVEQWAFT
jgi:hypothetical protein